MDELLSRPAGEFEWGPTRWRDRIKNRMRRRPATDAKAPSVSQPTKDGSAGQTGDRGPLVSVALVALGSAAIAIGGVSIWTSYNQPVADAAPVIIAAPTLTPVPAPTAAPTPTSLPTPTPTATAIPTVVVHVSGQVASPGIVEVSMFARAYVAVEAAGGALDDADLDRVNLAAPLVDGLQLHIPAVGEDEIEPAPRVEPTVRVPAPPPPTLVPTSTPNPIAELGPSAPAQVPTTPPTSTPEIAPVTPTPTPTATPDTLSEIASPPS